MDLDPKDKSLQTSLDFIRNKFIPFYENYGPRIQETVVFGLLQHMMNVLEGRLNAKVGEKLMDFFLLVSTAR